MYQKSSSEVPPLKTFAPHLCVAAIALGVAALCGIFATDIYAGETDTGGALGRNVADLELLGLDGKTYLLSDYYQGIHQGSYEKKGDIDHSKRFVAIIFLGTQCPIGNQYIPVLNELQKKYADRRFQLIGINSNRGDTLEEVAEHVKEYEIEFPVLKDPQGHLARALGVKRMTETFLLDPQRIVCYQGRVDDRFGYTHKRNKARRHDLAEALDELLAGKPVSVTNTKVPGCLITLPKQTEIKKNITYATDVATIVQNKCQNCHHEGTAAPFSLNGYEDVVNWQEMIREVVLERRMPAWHADPRYGEFSNDRRLTQKEIDTLVAWIDQGAPLGDEKNLPPQKEYVDGWMIDQPDIVIDAKEFETPASGDIPYQYFVTEPNFEKDIWIEAAEARPGNRAVVHHIITFHFDPNKEKPGDGAGSQKWITGTAPGDIPLILPKGVALKIPKGSHILWQMHYTPTGKKETDRSKIGLRLYRGEEPPKHFVEKAALLNTRFRIPPGASNYPVTSKKKIHRDIQLLAFMPHMHLRGKDFLYRAVFPDGHKEIVLSVPRYNFNWQSSYRLKEPFFMPAGSTLECVAHFDNSLDNPANPADPPVPVRWGEQTWEEMMIGYVDYIDAPANPGSGAKRSSDKTASTAAPGKVAR